MKKYYKVASLAIAGALAASTVIPAFANAQENTVNEASQTAGETTESQITTPEESASQVTSEAASGVSSSDVQSLEQATDETANEETTVGTTDESKDNIQASEDATEVANQAEQTLSTEDAKNSKEANENTSEEITEEEAKTATEEAAVVEETTDAKDAEATDALEEKTELESEEEELKKKLEEEELKKKLEEEELKKKLEELELKEPKDTEDFNEDGLSDLVTKRLCDGEILTEDGKKVFGDYTYEQVQATDDLDGDGLLNGDEVKIHTREDGTEYAELLSDPCKLDTDGDGINDADDTAPWEYGLAGGVVGSVRLVARHDESKGDPTHGHVYIVYTSYVNGLEISIDDLYGYYVTNPEYKERLDAACDSEDASIVSWRSTVDEITDANDQQRAALADEMYPQQNHESHTAGKITLNRGDYISIGDYGMASIQDTIVENYLPEAQRIFARDDQAIIDLWKAVTGQEVTKEYVHEHLQEILAHLAEDSSIFVDYVLDGHTEGGVWINRELSNQKYGYDQSPNQVVEQDATSDQLNVMLDYFSANSYFNIFNHNCSTVGTGAWNAAFGYEKDENGETVTDEAGEKVKSDYYAESSISTPLGNFSFPSIVKNSISKMASLPGYIGEMTYVTGKKLINTVNTAVKTFDVSKLFQKKTKTADNTDNQNVNPSESTDNKADSNTGATTGDTNQGSSSSSSSSNNSGTSSSSNSSSSSSTSVAAADGVITALSSVTANATADSDTQVVEGTRNRASSNNGRRVAAAIEDEEATAEEEEKIEKKDSLEEEKTIEDEETPLSIKDTKKANNWIWLVVAAFVAAAGAGTAIAIKKKNS